MEWLLIFALCVVCFCAGSLTESAAWRSRAAGGPRVPIFSKGLHYYVLPSRDYAHLSQRAESWKAQQRPAAKPAAAPQGAARAGQP